MTHNASTAYACVAYRIMEYEGSEPSEEYLDVLLDVLYGFYTEKEILNVYRSDIVFNSFDAVMKEDEIKKETE